MQKLLIPTAAIALFAVVGCQDGVKVKHEVEPVKVEPIKVEPIHITVDVNVKIDRKLDNFFDFEDKIEERVETKDGEPGKGTPPAEPSDTNQ